MTLSERLKTITTRRRVVAGALALPLVLALAALTFPVGLFRGMAERSLSEHIGAPVRIGAMAREDWIGLEPVVRLSDVGIAQPEWAGKGDMLTIRRARIRFPVLRALFGDVRPTSIAIEGMRAELVRDTDGRANWDGGDDGKAGSGLPRLSHLRIADSRFRLRDAKRKLVLAGTIASDARGLSIAARGTHRGQAAALRATGGALAGIDPAAPYPFSLSLRTALASLEAKGRMKGALDLDRFEARMAASGQDVAYLDDIIEAGLLGTQDFALTGEVRHDAPDWHVEKLSGRIGQSRIAGRVSALKRGGRARIEGVLDAAQFDFDDLSDDEGLAIAARKRARFGDRVIPDTRINLEELARTDGVLRFNARRIVGSGAGRLRAMSGVLKLDKRVLRVDDLVMALPSGRVTGAVRVDHRAGNPKLSLDLTLAGARLEGLVGSAEQVSAPLSGRVRLSGEGETIRAALAQGNGSIGLVARGGTVRASLAAILGQDIGRALGFAIGDGEERAGLRCLVARFAGKGGSLTADPVTIDTDRARSDGRGGIVLSNETIGLVLRGAPKGASALRSDTPLYVSGTLANPAIRTAAPGRREKGPFESFLSALGDSIGNAFTGQRAPRAADADCDALAAKALG